jgi:hypothetical protein
VAHANINYHSLTMYVASVSISVSPIDTHYHSLTMYVVSIIIRYHSLIMKVASRSIYFPIKLS